VNDIAKRIAALSSEQQQLLRLRLQQKDSCDRDREKTISISKRKDNEVLNLSFIQERIWFLNQLQPQLPLYNESSLFCLEGELNIEFLKKSINKIIERQEILRISFQTVGDRPLQIIAPNLTITLPIVEIKEDGKTKQNFLIQQIVTEYASQPFDLSKSPLLRLLIVKLNQQKHLLLITMHHIISDGWSWKVFYQELTAFYQSYLNKNPLFLPKLSVQYADYAIWQRKTLDTQIYQHQLAYWRQQLKDINPILDLPKDKARPAISKFRGARETIEISASLTEKLKVLSKQEKVTLFIVLLTAFKVLLYRYTRQTDIVVGTPVANRNYQEIENLLGCFVNTLVLRTKFSEELSFLELLTKVRETALAAYAHRELPFEQLVKEVEAERSLSHNPLFQVMFVFQDAPLQALELSNLKISPLIVDLGVAKFDITLFLEDTKNSLIGALEYNTEIFEAATIKQMVGHFQTLLEGIVTNPTQKIFDLPLLTKNERQQLLIEWNQTQTDYSRDTGIHQLIETQIEQTPDAIALVFENLHLTYRELNNKANRLADDLQGLGIKPDVIVGIYMERSLEMAIAILAILKAGGAYLPLDPTYPKERLAFMMADAQVSVLLTQSHLVETLPSQQAQVICLDRYWQKQQTFAGNPIKNPKSKIQNLYNLAYVIYTSGSTGAPKGVLNTHLGLSNRLLWMQDEYNLTNRDRVLQKTPFSFDVSVWEFLWSLLAGATLVLAKPEGHRDSAYLVELINAEQITTLHFVPSMLQVFLEEPQLKKCHSLKRVFCSGEALSLSLQERFFARFDAETNFASLQFHNLYGPTEAAIDVTYWHCQHHDERQFVPLGRAIANTQIYILDRYLQPVPIGVVGELHIGGLGLARGYLNRTELTEEKFIANPFKQGRLYKTGDLARYHRDGAIEYIGRIDHQVKLRGFRIELGEIERALLQYPGIRETIVTLREDAPGDKRLVSYIVLDRHVSYFLDDLQSFLKKQLPSYMVPSAFVVMDALPLTPNGKVDRRALPTPNEVNSDREKTFVAANTPIEEMLTGIWAQILGLDRVGIHDNFFELGGHSLLATGLISQVRKQFQVELSPRCLFEAPTVARFAEYIKKAIATGEPLNDLPISPVSRETRLPLSFGQQRLWIIDRLEPESTAYNGSNIILIEGELDLVAFKQSIQEVIQRHEILRTSFVVVEGQPVQKIASVLEVPLTLIDIENLPESERKVEVKRHEKTSARQIFDLTKTPLLRLVLLRLKSDRYILVLTMHHIVSDAWSAGIFIREVSTLYEAFINRKPSPLPTLPIQYADFSSWQQKWLQGERLNTQLNYWRRQLEGANTKIELPIDKPRSQVESFVGGKYSFAISSTVSNQLKKLSRQEGATLFMTLLAAFNVLLYCYTGQEDILIGSPIANRDRLEINNLIGFFVNTIVLRSDLSNAPSFSELLQRVREVSLEAYANQDLPFEQLVTQLQPERYRDRSPLFQVWFVLQNVPQSELKLSGLNLSFLESESLNVRHDLKLDLTETSEGIKGFFEYKTDLFYDSTIERMAIRFETLLNKVVEQPELKLSQLVELVNEAEREKEKLEYEELKEKQSKQLGKIKRKAITGNIH
jgi:amino acid adenylation domain-containing protein